MNIRHFITDLGEPLTLTEQDGTVTQIGRYGVWRQGPGSRRAEVVDTGDNLLALCQKYGLCPDQAIQLSRGGSAASGR